MRGIVEILLQLGPLTTECQLPADTRRNNNVIITSKRRLDVVST